MPKPSYHRLTVKAIRDETENARSFVLSPERGETTIFNYLPGQFLTFRIPYENGSSIIRSYSLSSAPGNDPDMTVCVKRVEEGRGSNWFNDRLSVGARIDAQPPAGRFTLGKGNAPLFLIAGGSGITPCISLVKQALLETGRSVKLLYANQHEGSIIYREVLDQLANLYPNRFYCDHWLDIECGFMTPEYIITAIQGWQDADIYICGPAALMDMAEETLGDYCDENVKILTERFVSPDDTPEIASPQATRSIVVESRQCRVTLDGVEHELIISPDQTVLEAALAAKLDVPHSCTEGHCGSCMAQLREGDVSMNSTQALSRRNIERGYVLACQARPSTSSPLWVDFDF